MSATPAPKKPARKPAAKPQKERGNISPGEIQPLIMAAREAYAFQCPGISFDEWRSEEVMAAVGKPGLTACDHDHFCDLMGHFKLGSGKDEEALEWFLKSEKNPLRVRAWQIEKKLTDHAFLAHATVDAITAATPPRALKRRLVKRQSLLDHPEGPITYDYLLSIVRDITRRPQLELGPDLAASLADRCDLKQLFWILCTLTNRIAEREGTGLLQDRNKSQKTEAARRRRSPHEMAPRPGLEH
jgi:hypothetical protein